MEEPKKKYISLRDSVAMKLSNTVAANAGAAAAGVAAGVAAAAAGVAAAGVAAAGVAAAGATAAGAAAAGVAAGEGAVALLQEAALSRVLSRAATAAAAVAGSLWNKERQVRRGELFEALPEAEQPSDEERIVLVDGKSLRLVCRKADFTRLTNADANLLLTISSLELRFAAHMEQQLLQFGRRLLPGDSVLVSVKGFNLPGVVRYKGELCCRPGTMFGVELPRHPGEGTSDGTYRNKRYFTCPPDSGVFVGLEKLTPREDPDSKIPPKPPERDGSAQANFKSRLMDTVMPQERINQVLEKDQRVVTFIEDHLARGTVRYISQEEDLGGNVHTIAGLEMDERVGTGTGKRNGRQLFVCKNDFAVFVDIRNLIREEDFDGNHKETTCIGKKTPDEQDATQEPIRKDEPLATSMSYDYRPSDEIKLSEKDQQEENSRRQLSKMEQRVKGMEQRVKGMEQQLREKDRELENSERLSREREQHLTNFQRQLREKELQEAIFHEQLREKEQQEENSQRQLMEIQQLLREKDEQEENLQGRLREMEQQLREEEDQTDNLQRQLREMEQQLTNLQRQFREKGDETANLQEQVTTQEQQLRVKDQQVNELEVTLSTAQQALSEHQRRQVTPDWVTSRDQIQLTDKLLGKGAWGSVVEGKYCGCAVAVKQIHELILSPHNRTLFEREMDIASRCRHPCLLQFIGATNDEGSPLFVTELMESSLRALLEQRPLSATEVSIISLDVARALNYLHQKKPPIVHRDISSANVLLWRQGDQWRGKVSDYGTANFMQHTMTAFPGAIIYIAPEALTSNQTVKVDVYSFGVLLCEMCIGELPDPERRDQQIAMVTKRLLRTLIRGCLQSEPEARPNMEEIIEELEEPV